MVDKSEHILVIPPPIMPVTRTAVNAQRSHLRVQRGVIAPATGEATDFAATPPHLLSRLRSIDRVGVTMRVFAIIILLLASVVELYRGDYRSD